MSFLNSLSDGIKGAIFKDEPNSAPAQPQPTKPQPANVSSTPGIAGMVIPNTNNQFVEVIRKQVFTRVTAFTALQNAADSLKDIIPDPVTRLKAAHKTGGLGRSTKEFSDAITIHLNDVDSEERRFTNALEQKVTADVGGLKTQAQTAQNTVTSLTDQIAKAQEQILLWQNQIAEKSTLANQLLGEASQKEAELRQSEQEFKAAAQIVRDELNTQRAAINSTLG